MHDLAQVRAEILERSPLGPEKTRELLGVYFRRVPLRTQYALERFPLAASCVLDVGCAYGTSLIHFGPGSAGVDNYPEAVAFCEAIGLTVHLADVDSDETDFTAFGTGYDFIWVSDILEHIDAPRLLLRRLAPLLAPDGRLLLQTSALPTAAPARALLRARAKQPFDAEVHYHQWTRHTLTHLLARAGLRVVDVAVPRPPAWRRLDPILHPSVAPRLILVAAPDAALAATADRSERRNRRAD